MNTTTGHCKTCDEGYGLHSDGICYECPTNCAECSVKYALNTLFTSCDACEDDFAITNTFYNGMKQIVQRVCDV